MSKRKQHSPDVSVLSAIQAECAKYKSEQNTQTAQSHSASRDGVGVADTKKEASATSNCAEHATSGTCNRTCDTQLQSKLHKAANILRAIGQTTVVVIHTAKELTDVLSFCIGVSRMYHFPRHKTKSTKDGTASDYDSYLASFEVNQ